MHKHKILFLVFLVKKHGVQWVMILKTAYRLSHFTTPAHISQPLINSY